MADINNLEKLTDQIYQEGIEKAEKESQKIVSTAKTKYNHILEEASAEAKRIVTKAEQESVKIKRSTENELQLKGKQLISDLQNEIQALLSSKILENNASEAFIDVSFIQSAILEAISSWKSSDGLELILPQELEGKLSKAFEGSLKKQIENLTITFNNKISSGFRIVNKADSYQIAFSKDEFVMLFRSYLSDRTNQLLFSKPS